VNCANYGVCEPNHHAFLGYQCQCPTQCPPDVSKVCGSDGRTYRSECVLRRESCHRKFTIVISYRGSCGELKYGLTLYNFLLIFSENDPDFSRWRSTCKFLKLNWARSLFLFQKETTNYLVINIIKSLIIYEKNGKKVHWWVYKNNKFFLTFVYTFSSIFSVSKPTSFWTKFLKTRLLKFLCFTSCIQHCISNLIQHGRILLFSSYKSNLICNREFWWHSGYCVRLYIHPIRVQDTKHRKFCPQSSVSSSCITWRIKDLYWTSRNNCSLSNFI
jgi:hypothetical protein